MCYFEAMMGAGSIMATLSGYRQEDKMIGQQIAAQNAMKQQKVKEMNYTLQDLTAQQQGEFDQAVVELQTNSINSIRNQGALNAAFGETNLTGRSMEAVMRETLGQEARQADSIRGNFKSRFASTELDKEKTIMNTQASIDGMPKINKPSKGARIMGLVNAGVSGWATGGALSGIGSQTSGGLSGMFKTGANTGLKGGLASTGASFNGGAMPSMAQGGFKLGGLY